QIRAGTDIAFLGGFINYAIENNRIAKDYLINYTNAAFIVKDGFKLPDDGLFSGFDQGATTYDKTTWNYEEGGKIEAATALAAAASKPTAQSGSANSQSPASSGKGGGKDSEKSGEGGGHQAAGATGAAAQGGQKPPPMLPPNVAYDLSLQHPRSVFQLLKQQYSRYTPEMVERITGIPKDQFLKAADLFTSIRKDGNMKKAGTIIYAVGWTQHTFGTQI